MSRKSYKAWESAEPTPTYAEAIELGAFKGTRDEWLKLTAGFRREIVRTTKRMKTGA